MRLSERRSANSCSADWIVGIAAVVVIAAAVFAGINHGKFTVSDNSLAPGMKPPSTTGFGGSSPQSMNPPKRSDPYQ